MIAPTKDPDEGAGAESELPSVSASFLRILRGVIADDPTVVDDRRRIGRFEVMETLGEGGFGVVFRVFDPIARVERAMKVPTPRILESEGELRRFVDEARKFARVDHPNVARMLEVEDAWAMPYLVMELCPEGSLADWLKSRKTPISPRWAAILVAEISDGVEAIHQAGLLHRDLKPGNVLLVRTGEDADEMPRFRPKISDFGISKFVEDSMPLDRTASGSLVGTTWAMSPEAARNAKEIGRSSDVYGLGVILYALLTGRRIHQGLSDLEAIDGLRSRAPSPSPKAVRDDLDDTIVAICRKMLAKDPRDRYPSAAAVAADLRRYLDGHDLPPIPRAEKVRSFLRRRSRGLIAAVTALALVAATFAVVIMILQSRAETWMINMRSASIDDLPTLLENRPFVSVEARLRRMLRSPDEAQKLAASIALAETDAAQARYVIERFLEAPAVKIEPFCRAMTHTIPDVVGRLHEAMARGEGSESSRANAAIGLVHLGHPADGFSLFRRLEDPGARAYLIHRLGPSGIAPEVLLSACNEPKLDAAMRRGLLLSLGELAADKWSSDAHRQAEELAAKLYADDPDSGIHGAAKWLLQRWKIPTANLVKATNTYRDGFGWRFGPSGLTFVRVRIPALGREIEVADAELTANDVHRIGLDYRPDRQFCPSDDCPATGINWLIAAGWCNAIGSMEGTPPAYGPGRKYPFEPVPGHVDRPGLRMPAADEFAVYCRAGTTNDRYFGDALDLASSYAHHAVPADSPRTSPVGLRKPNDLGLFDCLGNAQEFGEAVAQSPDNLAILLGGSVLQRPQHLTAVKDHKPFSVKSAGIAAQSYGLRPVNTLATFPVQP